MYAHIAKGIVRTKMKSLNSYCYLHAGIVLSGLTWFSKSHFQRLFLTVPSRSCKLSCGKFHPKNVSYDESLLFQGSI